MGASGETLRTSGEDVLRSAGSHGARRTPASFPRTFPASAGDQARGALPSLVERERTGQRQRDKAWGAGDRPLYHGSFRIREPIAAALGRPAQGPVLSRQVWGVLSHPPFIPGVTIPIEYRAWPQRRVGRRVTNAVDHGVEGEGDCPLPLFLACLAHPTSQIEICSGLLVMTEGHPSPSQRGRCGREQRFVAQAFRARFATIEIEDVEDERSGASLLTCPLMSHNLGLIHGEKRVGITPGVDLGHHSSRPRRMLLEADGRDQRRNSRLQPCDVGLQPRSVCVSVKCRVCTHDGLAALRLDGRTRTDMPRFTRNG